jgi:murein DD-endopeptidase MepM/ murein hydrolase activator NlpD
MDGRRKIARRLDVTAAVVGAGLLIALGCMFAGLLSGCSTTRPSNSTNSGFSPAAEPRRNVTYTVAAGDTLYHIASVYGVSVGRLMTANSISDPRELRVGQTLVIPGSYRHTPLARAETSSIFPYHGERASRQFQWPVESGVVSSGFGIRNGAMHDGVDIAAPAGTPVRAADSGTVIFSGHLHGYGNTIIIRHDRHYATVYGHDQVNLVREGQQVERGQTIGEIGATGRASGDNLHFEVRRDNIARNPLAFLPPPEPPAAITFAAGGGS